MNLASLVSAPAFSSELILYRNQPGYRDENGRWVPGGFSANDIEGVSVPLEGAEREVLPEGLRGKNTRRFFVTDTVIAVSESSDGDVIQDAGQLFRVQEVKRWPGFWEVTAVQGNTDGLGVPP